jgi:peptidoglycan/LPS O-acetylase OafA/YrhL
VRALSALYVVLYHVAQTHRFPGSNTVRFGPEAVMAFFLLSGFVIYANEHERARSPWGYYLRRVRRIYPPLIVAMVVSTLVFAANGTLDRDFSIGPLVGTLLGVQDLPGIKPGVIVGPYLGNSPLWSLSYELFFYAVFPLLLRLRGRITDQVGAVALLGYATYLAVPNHWSLVLSYLLVWWTGAALARVYLDHGTVSLRLIRREVAWLVALIAVAAVGVAVKGRHGLGYFPELEVRHFAAGLIFLVLATTGLARLFARTVAKAAGVVAAVAGISYGIYVVHYPLVAQWNQARTTRGLAEALLLTVAGAILCDRVLPRVLPRAPQDLRAA